MLLKTKHFGEIEIDEEKIITFEDGLLGFEDIKKYVVIENPDEEVPFDWLQSVDEPELTFVITDPFLFNKEYEFNINDDLINELEKENILVYTIAVVPDDIKNMTINLKAPIIVNTKDKKAKQMIIENNKYPLKYKIFEK